MPLPARRRTKKTQRRKDRCDRDRALMPDDQVTAAPAANGAASMTPMNRRASGLSDDGRMNHAFAAGSHRAGNSTYLAAIKLTTRNRW
jgi:hypothetical protein